MIVVGDQQLLIDLSKTKARTIEAKSKHYRQPQLDEPWTAERTQSGKTTNGKDEETEKAFLKISHPYEDVLPRAREADTWRSHPITQTPASTRPTSATTARAITRHGAN
ncbi:unnamed protein product [Brassica rapa]|uniref:Uncharacterized protein n=1 Tax=Brassica campestris TaxID=3711 RepID=A0A3P6BI02_BRACM|nr:unnamed protein product [Brassica rapa]VDC98714.1 unnamed protein product [Brassica rapa]